MAWVKVTNKEQIKDIPIGGKVRINEDFVTNLTGHYGEGDYGFNISDTFFTDYHGRIIASSWVHDCLSGYGFTYIHSIEYEEVEGTKDVYLVDGPVSARYIVNKLYEEGYEWVNCEDRHRFNDIMKILVADDKDSNMKLYYSEDDENSFAEEEKRDADNIFEVYQSKDVYMKRVEKKREPLISSGNIIFGDFGLGFTPYIIHQHIDKVKAINLHTGGYWSSMKTSKQTAFTPEELDKLGVLPLLTAKNGYKIYKNLEEYINDIR